MKSQQSTILRLAIAAMFAGGAVGSHAAVNLNSPTAVKFASELPTTGLDLFNNTTTGGTDLNFSATVTTFTPSVGQSLQVTVNLSNGATFSGNPTLTCNVGTAAGAGLGDVVTGVLNLGGNGTAQSVYTIAQTAIVAQVTTSGSISTSCMVSASAITVASGAHTDIKASITYQYGTLSSSTVSGSVITWAKGVSGWVTGATTLTAMVTGGFVTFTNTSTTTGAFGNVYYQGNGTARLDSTGLKASATDNLTSASITLGGNTLAVAKTGGVYLVTAGDVCTAGTPVASANAAASVTFGSTAGVTVAQLVTGYKACISVNGTSAIPAESITVSLTGNVNTGYSANVSLPSSTIATIIRNGSATRALNIPAANNADQVFIRITNTSTLAGKVYGTLYDQSGNVLGTSNSVLADAATFVPNATVVFAASDLKTKLGIASDWSGRAQLQITAETTAIRAQNTIRASNGTLVNVGGDTSSNNN
jgi:hypothetical protein